MNQLPNARIVYLDGFLVADLVLQKVSERTLWCDDLLCLGLVAVSTAVAVVTLLLRRTQVAPVFIVMISAHDR